MSQENVDDRAALLPRRSTRRDLGAVLAELVDPELRVASRTNARVVGAVPTGPGHEELRERYLRDQTDVFDEIPRRSTPRSSSTKDDQVIVFVRVRNRGHAQRCRDSTSRIASRD